MIYRSPFPPHESHNLSAAPAWRHADLWKCPVQQAGWSTHAQVLQAVRWKRGLLASLWLLREYLDACSTDYLVADMESWAQTFQVPADGLRDGYLGDDDPVVRAKEGLQVDILPCRLIVAIKAGCSGADFHSAETYGLLSFILTCHTGLNRMTHRNEKHMAPA